MWLQTRMFLLVAVLFGILYGVITGIGAWMGTGSALAYIILAFIFLGIQYLIGPSIVGWTMKIKWVSEKEAPELHRMVAEQAKKAHLPKPKVGISQLALPNAFAFGRTGRDGRVCVTQGILNLLSRDELKAVIGHEISHIKHRDMIIITLISAIPLIMYWLAWSMMFRGAFGGRRDGGGYTVLIGVGAFILYFITNLLVLYAPGYANTMLTKKVLGWGICHTTWPPRCINWSMGMPVSEARRSSSGLRGLERSSSMTPPGPGVKLENYPRLTRT